MNALLVLGSLLTIIFYLLYLLTRRKFGYWKIKNVPYVEPVPLLGNYAKFILQREYSGHVAQKLCQNFIDQPYFGAFYGTEPVLVVHSPEMIKHVLTKDFYYVNGREATNYAESEVITKNLFFAGGNRWKTVRQNLTPLFSSSKMKNMYYLIEKCSIVFEDMIDYEMRISDVLEVRQICLRYTMDCICSAAFGVESNTMEKEESNPFRFIGNEIFKASNYRGFKRIFRAIWPAIFYRFGFQLFPSTIDQFFSKLLTGVFKSRDYKPSPRNDFVDLVLTFKNKDYLTGDSLCNAKTGAEEKVQLKVDDDLLVAQCVVFFAAGFETSSTTMSHTLFELAKHQEVQQRVAEEVDEFLRRHGNKLKYECVHEMPYLEACTYETLRKYPVLGNLTREVMDDYVLPTGLKLDVGVRIHLPVYYMHHNPDYFPEPQKYKPERFLPENKDDVKPYTFFPFGTGPRLCIGMRFAKMQVMSGLITILKKYRVELADGMPETLTLDSRTSVTQPKDQGIMLKMVERRCQLDTSAVVSDAFANINALLVLGSLLTVIFYLLYLLSKRKFGYWKIKKVPYVEPVPLLGNYGRYILQKEYPGQVIQKLCQKFSDQPYFGAFYGTEPVLVVLSPDIIKQVLTKDFYYVNGRESTNYSESETVTQTLFFSGGDKWKIVRQNLTPLFSSSKMKNMYHLIEKCSIVFEDMLEHEVSMSDVLEIRESCMRYTMDCICSAAFGVESNTMGKEDNNPFRFMGSEIFEASNYRGFKIIFRAVWPAIFYRLGFQIFPQTIDQFFSKLLKGVFESRGYKPSSRNDFVDLVLTLKNDDYITGDSISNVKTGAANKVQLKVDEDLLVAQCVQFFGAGFETSASTMSFTLFELAKNQDVQQKVAAEVDDFLRRHGNKLSYECVNELPYLEACMYETLRKFPVIGNLTREVMDDYVLPTGLKLDVGVRVHVPVYYMHFNPKYFPEPQKYKPERFLPENKDDVEPYTFFPFGSGPRLCIGMRFAIMQVMSGLITILKTYRVELADGMPETMILDPRTLLTQPKDQGIMLKMIKREGWEGRRLVRSDK